MKKFIPFVVAATLSLGACASGGAGGDAGVSDKDAQSAILAAEHELKRVSAKGYAWRDTEKLIKAANEAVKAGDFAKATKLANEAKEQSTNALAQYESQKNAAPNF